MQLQASIIHLVLQLRGPPLRHCRFFGRQLTFIQRDHAAIDKFLADSNFRLHFRQNKATILKRPDGLSKSLSLLYVFQRQLKTIVRRGDRGHSNV